MKKLYFVRLVMLLVSTVALAQSNPIPLINDPLVPTSAAPGGVSFTLTINGTGFVSSSIVTWNGSPLATSFVSGSQLTATVPAANIAAAGTASVRVLNPAPAGASNIQFFNVRAPFSESSFGLSSFGSIGGQPLWIVTADVNNDGKPDLISTSDSDIYVSLGNGDGTFQPAVGYAAGGNSLYVSASDFNGDGNLDLAATGFGTLSILLGNGDGTFQPFQYAPGAEGALSVEGDFNGDGRQDIAVTAGPAVAILLGNGDGTFQNPVYYSVTNSQNYATFLATGDFNGDGKLDLVATVQSDSAFSILLGNGDGTFQNPTETSVEYQAGDVVAADLNRDGKLDLAIYVLQNGLRGEGEIATLVGNGDGTFQPPTYYPLGGVIISGLKVGDLNGDGILDLIADTIPGGNSHAPGNLVVTYLGHGDGTFRTQGFFATGNRPVSVALGDFNDDGMLDVATANNGDSTISVLLEATAVLSRTEITFPRTKVGNSTTESVVLANIGNSSFSIGKISFNGNGTSSFSQTNNCGTSLAAGAHCTIKVTFAPTVARQFLTMKLEISDSAVNTRQTVYIKAISVAN
jgi:hypothetical protein